MIGRIVALCLLAAGPAVACQAERRAEVAVSLAEGFVDVPALVNGRPARFLLDTGAGDMLVTPAATARLALDLDPTHSTRLLGTGGEGRAPNAWLDGVRLGNATLERRSVPVAALPSPLAADGLIGAPLLAVYDLDLNLVESRIGLFHVEGCAANAPLLPSPFTSVPLTPAVPGSRVPAITVVVNGVRLTALLDTGARSTSLTPAAAERVGARLLASGGTTRGIDGAAVRFRSATVTMLSVGWDTQKSVEISVAPLDIEGADMLLGTDWLRQRRVWISYATGQVLIALRHDWR